MSSFLTTHQHIKPKDITIEYKITIKINAMSSCLIWWLTRKWIELVLKPWGPYLATKLVKEKQKTVAITRWYRDAWSMMVTLVGIKQLLLQISNLSVTHVNLLLKLHYLGLHSTITFIRLQHTVKDTWWAKTWKYIHKYTLNCTLW